MQKVFHMKRELLSLAALTTPRRRALASVGVLVAFGLASLVVAASSASARAQQKVQPSISNEVKGGKKADDVPKTNEKPQQPTRGGRRPRPTPTPIPTLEVTFTSDMPEAEIFLYNGGTTNNLSLGKIGADGKLLTRLARGTYNIMASRIGHPILKQRIEVRPGFQLFSFKFTPSAPTPKRTETVEATPTPTPAETTQATGGTDSDKALSDFDELARRFLDAKETEGLKADDWQRALTGVNGALDKEPDNSALKARALVAQGQLAYLREEYPDALIAFNKAALEVPNLPAAHYGRANTYLATNQPVEAFKAYQRVAELQKDSALALKGMGDALLKQGKQKEANSYYARAKMVGGTQASVGLTAARSLKTRKQWAQALREFQELSSTQPSSELFIDIGDCYVGLKQLYSATQAYRRAVELDAKSALAHYKYGEVMWMQNEYGAAAEALEKALALDLTGASINRERARDLANKATEKMRKRD